MKNLYSKVKSSVTKLALSSLLTFSPIAAYAQQGNENKAPEENYPTFNLAVGYGAGKLSKSKGDAGMIGPDGESFSGPGFVVGINSPKGLGFRLDLDRYKLQKNFFDNGSLNVWEWNTTSIGLNLNYGREISTNQPADKYPKAFFNVFGGPAFGFMSLDAAEFGGGLSSGSESLSGVGFGMGANLEMRIAEYLGFVVEPRFSSVPAKLDLGDYQEDLNFGMTSIAFYIKFIIPIKPKTAK